MRLFMITISFLNHASRLPKDVVSQSYADSSQQIIENNKTQASTVGNY